MDKSFTDKGWKNAQTFFLGYNLFWGVWADSNMTMACQACLPGWIIWGKVEKLLLSAF